MSSSSRTLLHWLHHLTWLHLILDLVLLLSVHATWWRSMLKSLSGSFGLFLWWHNRWWDLHIDLRLIWYHWFQVIFLITLFCWDKIFNFKSIHLYILLLQLVNLLNQFLFAILKLCNIIGLLLYLRILLTGLFLKDSYLLFWKLVRLLKICYTGLKLLDLRICILNGAVFQRSAFGMAWLESIQWTCWMLLSFLNQFKLVNDISFHLVDLLAHCTNVFD